MKNKNHKPRNTNTNPATDQPNQTKHKSIKHKPSNWFFLSTKHKNNKPWMGFNGFLEFDFVFLFCVLIVSACRNSSNRCQIPNISKCSAVSCFGCNILLQLLLSPSNSCLSYKNWKEISIRKNITFNLKSNLKRK